MIERPAVFDAFAGAGGAASGYAEAGAYVVGIDREADLNWPSHLPGIGPRLTGDAVEALENLDAIEADLGVKFVAIHASPPCQFATKYRNGGNVRESPNLIPATRAALEKTGRPWIIENVEGARSELRDPLLLCGSMIEPEILDVQRHRYFESNFPLEPPRWPCRHRLWGKDRFPGGRSKERTGSSRGLCRSTVEIGSWDIPLDVQRAAMAGHAFGSRRFGEWMTLEELSESIPGSYTAFLGAQLLAAARQVT